MTPVGYRYLAKSIDDLLWYAWDPIGVNDPQGPADEYASYAAKVRDMVFHKATADEVFTYLRDAETTNMGLHDANVQRTRQVADHAITLGEWARGLI
ncbi:MAG TPA: hypothetical protein VHX44_09395 [Planctomycetota bacterium]|nr:hypothetical protein [Planctomycetota bacterium]